MGIENIEILFPYEVVTDDQEDAVVDGITEFILEPIN
jgi:hypothetical protein